ncbi:hypothetical protein EJ04DRAFT_25373 [Polyplosphaeria fusca]|uniref:Uncharacterized protein n=1 Tax=Polyplosphaeria fusca TaxID=682080 RepID=A0A9P4V6X1_9PLEO|nr:hypothetical protein EJ04DRAFT_25373 [Polyplosphaeria fusca]
MSAEALAVLDRCARARCLALSLPVGLVEGLFVQARSPAPVIYRQGCPLLALTNLPCAVAATPREDPKIPSSALNRPRASCAKHCSQLCPLYTVLPRCIDAQPCLGAPDSHVHGSIAIPILIRILLLRSPAPTLRPGMTA